MDQQIVNLLENFAYDVSTSAKLEAHVNEQLSSGSYEFAVNKGLLKNYQINGEIAKVDFVSKVLILSLMRLPSTDFLALSYLVPPKMLSDSNVALILKCADLLERGNFSDFWEEYLSAPQALFAQAENFVHGVRLFILNNLRDTFSTISKSLFMQQLGLNDTSIVAYCESNNLVDRIEEAIVVFSGNEENQVSKSQQNDESFRVDESLKLTEFLRTN